MSEFTPDDVAQRDFRSSFRGYDPEEVRSFLRDVARGLRDLVEDRDRLRTQLGAGADADLKAEIALVGSQVAGVLEEARQVATSMRERASAETARWRSETVAECESELRQARADAEQLRSDAWSTAEELLAQAQRESARQVDGAKAEALRVLGEAEREAHKVTSAARRQADETVRLARMESERLSIEAQARHDGIIAAATRQAETAQERTRALEQRRDELKRELDTVREALASMEVAMDERRERLGLSSSAAAPSPAPAEEEEATTAKHWEGETVRVVRPEPGVAVPEPSEVSLQRLSEASEIRLITAEELKRRGEPPAEDVDVTAAAPEHDDQLPAEDLETAESPVVSTAELDDAAVAVEDWTIESDSEGVAGEPSEGEVAAESIEPAVEPSEGTPESPDKEPVEAQPEAVVEEPARPPQEKRRSEPTRQQSFDDLVGLFDRLRSEPPSQTAQSSVTDHGPGEASPAIEEAAPAVAPEPAEPRRPPVASGETDPFEVRDQLLLPVSNRALRNLKRQLAEEGNVALEELHLHADTWAPDVDAISTKVRADLVVLHAESFGAGHAAAERLSGERLSRPSTPRIDVASEFAGGLAGDIEHALSEGRNAGQGALQLKATVARVFRAWRTDESERRMRALSLAAFNAGLAETMRLNEREALTWVVSGRGCAMCRSRSNEPVSGQLPPAHSGCECIVVPG